MGERCGRCHGFFGAVNKKASFYRDILHISVLHILHIRPSHLLHSKDFEFKQGKVKEMHETMRRLWDAIPSICVYLSQRTVFDKTNGTHNEFFCHVKLTCSEWKLHPATDTFVFVQSSSLFVFPFKPGRTSSDGAAASNSFSVFAASPSGERPLRSQSSKSKQRGQPI